MASASKRGRRAALQLVPQRMAEDAFRRAGGETADDGKIQCPIQVDAGMGHRSLALQPERQERIGLAAGRPLAVVRAEEPERVELLPRRLKSAHDLDRSAARLGSEDRLRSITIKHGYKFPPGNAAAVEAEPCDLAGQPLPPFRALDTRRSRAPVRRAIVPAATASPQSRSIQGTSSCDCRDPRPGPCAEGREAG